MSLPIVIIGTGLAGYQLAREFRKVDQTTPLTIITSDEGHYYPKPQLSTALTSGKTSSTLITATASAMAEQLKATILTHTSVHAIDTVKKAVIFNNDELLYNKLVLACGAEVIRPEMAGDAAKEVLSINHLYHYAEFQSLIQNKKSIAILGAGLIGCEFANDLSNADYDVHVIAPALSPLDLLLPKQVGKLLQTALEENGVQFHFGCVAKSVNKKDQSYQLELSNGDTLTTDFILSAIGLKPHIDLAKTAQIKTNRGRFV